MKIMTTSELMELKKSLLSSLESALSEGYVDSIDDEDCYGREYEKCFYCEFSEDDCIDMEYAIDNIIDLLKGKDIEETEDYYTVDIVAELIDDNIDFGVANQILIEKLFDEIDDFFR